MFGLEELRDRKTFVYASRIQRFFRRFGLRQFYAEMHGEANRLFTGQKKRRRNSVERLFTNDYVSYRDNFPLKEIVEANGRESCKFAHAVNKYDRRGRKQKRIYIQTDQAVYIVAVDKNKDKLSKATTPWIFVCKRRIPIGSVQRVSLSTLSDNFVVLHGPDYDNLLECRRKTEMVALLSQV